MRAANVYRATDIRKRRTVAIAELRTGSVTYDRCRQRFQRAVEVSGAVRHPNLVTAYECPTDSLGNAYLVMEYVDGPTLQGTLASRGRPTIAQAMGIARDIGQALVALHERVIVHRDLSPTHILLAANGDAKVTALGDAQIGRERPRYGLSSDRPGTPGYISPEQESGFGDLDGRSDLYSLGAILYEMLAGEPYARAQRPITSVRPDLPPHLAAFVTKLLERQAAFRYQRAADVVRDLDAILHPPVPEETEQPGVPPSSTLPPSLAPSEPLLPAPAASVPPPPPPLPAPSAVTFAPSAPAPRLTTPVSSTPVASPAQPSRVAFPVAPLGQSASTPRARPPEAEIARPVFRPPPQFSDASVPPVADTGRKGRGIALIVVGVIVAFLVLSNGSRSGGALKPTATPFRTSPTQTAIARQPTVWNDPKGRINLTLPPGWRALSTGTKPDDVASVFGPDGVFFLIQTETITQSADAESQTIRTNQSRTTTRAYTQGPITDVTIGGEPGNVDGVSGGLPTAHSSSRNRDTTRDRGVLARGSRGQALQFPHQRCQDTPRGPGRDHRIGGLPDVSAATAVRAGPHAQ
jgi:serine/threonine protein kinase